MTVLKAIRQKCLDCCCYQPSEVAKCTATKCALHPFRMGKNPFRQKRVLSDEQKAALLAGLARARETQAN
jgi:hypothetical protein